MAKRTAEIRQQLLHQVFWGVQNPIQLVAEEFSLTPQAVHLHLKDLIRQNIVGTDGQRRQMRYQLKLLNKHQKKFPLDGSVTEDHVWNSFAKLHVPQAAGEENDICFYGLTEIFNNSVDHSSGKAAVVQVAQTAVSTVLRITDNGQGIFHKIATALKLSDPRQSLLELSKGKFTTDPKRHTGEGIFFSARLFDKFQIRSGQFQFDHSTRTDEWVVVTAEKKVRGTDIIMELLRPSTTVMQDIFSRFSSGPDEYRFAKTQIPLKLATFGDEPLLSRSSAKRVLTRADRFDEVCLDFSDVRSIGQAFADEIFRVFANAHPKVELISINANAQVTQMIRRAQSARRESP